MSGSGQVRALLALRWRMVRASHVRVGLGIFALVSLAVVVLGVISAATAPLGAIVTSDVAAGDFISATTDRTGEVAVLIPSAMLAFLLLCVVAPVAAGGGYELIPESQLVAYPVRVASLVRLSLVLSPLNLAWYLQVILLSVATGYAVRGPGGPGLPILVLLAFLAAATVAGQVVGWLLVGIRRTRAGRLTTWGLLAGLLAAGVWVIRSERAPELLDASPTRKVLGAQVAAAAQRTEGWVPLTFGLLVASLLGYLLAVRVASWALRRPSDLGFDGPLSRPVSRRPEPDSAYRALLRTDRASVWRSPPLRRGLIVLAVLPVAAALVAGLPWSSIVLLPPLVASGAALLFGVNAMSLDGSGALWIATLPHDPMLVLRSKARVVAEVVGGAIVIVLLGAGLRASDPPDLQDLLCAVGAAVGCAALVVSMCLRLSVTRPHRAELRGPRDTPAPPGAMAVYSVRLAAATTTVGLVFSVGTFGSRWWLPVVLTAGLLAWSARSWSRTRRTWADDTVRAGIVVTVASG